MAEKKKNIPGMPEQEHVTEIRVTYRDTDQMGHVYYANYLVYFETARTEFLRSLGRTYRSCEEEGIYLPVVEAQCQYREPALYDDVVQVTTRVSKWTRASLDFDYVCRRKSDGALLAEGRTRHAFTNEAGKISRVGHLVLKESACQKP